MFNTNWSLNHNASTSNVDWSALADTWMQQREQQAQWQHVAPPPPLPPPLPPPPPPQFLLAGPPIPPPGPPPMGMTLPPMAPAQIGLNTVHHQLQVGSKTTQESLTMTNIENPMWRSPIPPRIIPGGSPWRPPPPPPPPPNHAQPLFPIQSEMMPPYDSCHFWPSGTNHQPAPAPAPLPPPVPPPIPPAVVLPPQAQIPLASFPNTSFSHSSGEKRMLNNSLNTSIPSLMDMPPSYQQKSAPPRKSLPPVPSKLLNEPVVGMNQTVNNPVTKRQKIPAWLREELGRIEKEKEKKMNNSTTNTSINEISSKFDLENDDDETNNSFDNQSEKSFDENDESSIDTALVSSTPVVTRRTRFDEDQPMEPSLNISQISKSSQSPPPSISNTPTIEDETEKEEQFLMRLGRALTELLLEVTSEELLLLAKEVYIQCKTNESSTPVIRSVTGLSSLVQSFSASESESDEETDPPTIVERTVLPVSSKKISESINEEKQSKEKKRKFDFDSSTKNNKKKKSSKKRSRSSSSSSSRDHKHHQKSRHHRRRRHSSSSSSSSSSSRSRKTKKSSNSSRKH